MENTIYSLIPPILAIVMVIITKRVLLSLGTGILASALLLAKGNFLTAGAIIWGAIKGIIIDDGSLNTWNIYIVLFLFLLGAITALINITGGSRAFGEWAMTKVKNRAGAQILAAVFGIIIFIDDYFNALAVGQVARPITDRHRVSRAKLAYIIDSTSAPVCVIAPISSWGAFIISIIGTVFVTHNITDISPLTAFLQMVPMNLYVWTSLALVFIIAFWNIDFGSMRMHENRAIATGVTYDPKKPVAGELKEELPISEKGSIGDLIWPIAGLFIGTIAAIGWSGLKETEGNATMMDILGNADVSEALLYGGLIGLAVTIAAFIRQQAKHKSMEPKFLVKGIFVGIQSMMPAVLILLFAWAIGALIEEIGTGVYLASFVEKTNLSPAFLPVILFVCAGLMAFSTGTSWGSFVIMLPIAGQIMAAADMSLLLPAMAAVLAGSVFGDHCSPISDTTILSATGAGCNHMDHVLTQLPYAVTSAVISAIGYIVIGLTEQTIFGLFTIAILLLIFTWIMGRNKKAVQEVETVK